MESLSFTIPLWNTYCLLFLYWGHEAELTAYSFSQLKSGGHDSNSAVCCLSKHTYFNLPISYCAMSVFSCFLMPRMSCHSTSELNQFKLHHLTFLTKFPSVLVMHVHFSFCVAARPSFLRSESCIDTSSTVFST